MRLVNSLKHGLVIVLDPRDVEFGKRVSNDPFYQDKKLHGPLELNYQIKIFDELMGNIRINVYKHDPHVIPVLMAGALLDNEEGYLDHLYMVFDAYIALKTHQWGYIYSEEMSMYVYQQAWNTGFTAGIIHVYPDDDLGRW